MLLDTGRDAKHLLFASAFKGNDTFELRFCFGESPRLVENDGVGKRKFFQILAAFYGHVAVGRFAERRNHRNRGRKLDGARIVHHQNRDCFGNVTRKQEREPESDKAERHNSVGQAFSPALDRGLQVFGAVDEFDDFLNLGVAAYGPHRYYDGAFVHNGARKNGLPDRLVHCLRFARHGRFVHECIAFGNGSVHRNHATGTHTHEVAHLNILHTHLNIDTVLDNPHAVYLHGKACGKGRAGTRLGVIFQETTHVQQEHDGPCRFVIALQDARPDGGTVQHFDGEFPFGKAIQALRHELEASVNQVHRADGSRDQQLGKVTPRNHERKLVLETRIEFLQLVFSIGLALREICDIQIPDKINHLFTIAVFVFQQNAAVFRMDYRFLDIRFTHACLVDARFVYTLKCVGPRPKADSPRLIVGNSVIHNKTMI